MKFIEEQEGVWSAISTDVEQDGWFFSELYYADIDLIDNRYIVRFNDSYGVRYKFNSLEEAQKFISSNYYKHRPVENGTKYEIND